MTKIKEFKLALGVINNILVCDENDHILFAGDSIGEILFSSKKSYKKNILDNFLDDSVREALREKLENVRKGKNTHQLHLENKEKTIFLFPGNYNESHTIMLSTKDQMVLANKIEHDLKERVKELECLFTISSELENTNDLPAALDSSHAHLVAGFQFPDKVSARFEVDGRFYGSCQGAVTNRLIETIQVNDEPRGKIEVCIHDNIPFLDEEIKMLKEIALMVSTFIERIETRKNLEKQRKQLLVQNDELKQLTDNLSTSNDNLNALFGAITDIIVVIDKDFNISMSNKLEIGDGGKCYNKLFDSDRICENCPAMRVFREAQPAWAEKKHGDENFMLRAYPIIDKRGNVDRVIEICRNVTIEKRMEEHLVRSYKLASLGKLTAGVAHEINNPNTFIRGNINIVDEAFKDILPILDQAYRENPELKIARLNYDVFRENIPILLEDMVGGADRIKKIVDGLRNFAKKDEGVLTDDVNINDLIRNNLRITEKQVRRHARLKMELDENIPVFKGGISKLEQVLMNLLLNASHAIEHDHGVIVVSTGYDKAAKAVWIKISDNGKGIDEKTRRHIFDPFFTTKREKGGTGLGLSISYGIVQEHKGRIEVESKIGEGAAFTITLPVQSPETEQS